jgi:DNA-directed RNA polymerase specialized sigma24 family protein
MRPDFSHELAARTLGRSLGASRVLLARARAALLAKLEEQG